MNIEQEILQLINNNPHILHTSRSLKKDFKKYTVEQIQHVIKILRNKNLIYYQIIRRTFYYWCK